MQDIQRGLAQLGVTAEKGHGDNGAAAGGLAVRGPARRGPRGAMRFIAPNLRPETVTNTEGKCLFMHCRLTHRAQ